MEGSTNALGQDFQLMSAVNIDSDHDSDLGTERSIDSVSGQNSSNHDRRNRTEEPKVFTIAKLALGLCLVVGLCLLVSSIVLGYRFIKTSSRCDGVQDCSLSVSERHSVRQHRIASGVLFALGFLLVVGCVNIAVNHISTLERGSPQVLTAVARVLTRSDDLPGYEAALAMGRPGLPESEGHTATEDVSAIDEDLTNPPPNYEEALGFLGLHVARC